MESPDLRLLSLLHALFDDGGALWRFTRHSLGEHLAYDLDPEGTVSEQAERLVRRLRRERRIDDRFFDALAENRPDRAELVEEVRRELLGGEPRRGRERPGATRGGGRKRSAATRGKPVRRKLAADGGTAAASADRLAWRRRIGSLLASAPRDPVEPAAEWLEAAAVVAGFSPLELRPLGGRTETPPDLMERLVAVSDVLPDGRLSLHLEKRQETLARLVEEGRLAAALRANPDPSVHGKVLRRAVREGRVDARELRGRDELQAAHDVAEWLARSDFAPFDRDRLAARLDRQRRIEPLRRLLGEHFRGRRRERRRLRRHLAGDTEFPILSLRGIGGVGKSALLGKVMLELERHRRPWVYLDFDHPEADPLQPRRLVELIARQLGQFLDDAGAARHLLALESAASGDEFAFTFDLDVEAGAAVGQLLGRIDGLLRDLYPEPRLALVFDTFEQVQVRGTRAVEQLRGLLDALAEAMPYARSVVAGRAPVPWKDADSIELEDLDRASADHVLAALGVADPALRELVIERVGTSPLSLRLAADAIAGGQLDATDMEELALHVSELERQGQLYTRILGHIEDREVRRLAHPGLIVRRVTPGVIRDVLAELCEIDPRQADAIFARLPDHVALFEEDEATPGEGKALRHRQDVREKMLRLMVRDPEWRVTVAEIHRLAIEHYAGRQDPIARAEEIYHRLMRDDDPELFDHRWGEELTNSLGRCWNEPLPERARAWLRPRIRPTEGDREAWRTQDWEVSAAREARARLQSADPEGALAVLRGRPERTPGSRLHRLEAEALLRLGRREECRRAIDRALTSAAAAGRVDETLRLHLLGAELALDLADQKVHEAHLDRATEIAEHLGDTRGRMEILELRLRGARERGDAEEAARWRRRLEQAFVRAEGVKLRQDPELSRRLLREFGPESTPVWRKAAATFGNRIDQSVIRPDAFLLGDLFERLGTSSSGRRQLSRLAGEVGMSTEDYDVQDLASQAIRYGKLGDALVTLFDHSGDDAGLRQGAARMFHGLGEIKA